MFNFDIPIRQMIEKFAYDFYIVQLDKGVRCACVSVATKQAEANCNRCLGTGHRIVIRKIRGVSQNSTVMNAASISQPQNKMAEAPIYFVDKNYPVQRDDIIVDRGEAWVVQRVDGKKSDKRKIVYYKVITAPKKGHEQWLLAQVSRITGGG